MKKNLAKVFSVLMMLVLTMSLMACGSKSSSSSNLEKLSAEDLIKKMAEASKDVKGVSATGNFGGTITIPEEEVKANVTLTVRSNAEPLQAYVKADVDMEIAGAKQSITTEVYEISTEDKLEVYTNALGQWSYKEAELSTEEFDVEAVLEELKEIDFDTVSKYLDNIEVTTKDGKYNLVAEISSIKLIEKLKESEFASKLEDLDTSVVPDTKIKLTLSVDGKTFLPKSMAIDLDMDKIVTDDVEMEISDFVFDLKFDSFDSVKITVPDEALEAKENGVSSDLFE